MSGDRIFISNPSAWLFKIGNANEVKRFMVTLDRTIGEIETHDGPKDRKLCSWSDPAPVDYSGGNLIRSGERGIMVWDDKDYVDFERQFQRIVKYFFRYYLLDTDSSDILIVSAKKEVGLYMSRLLSATGMNVMPIHLNRRVQDCIKARPDVIDVRARVHDDIDPDLGSIDLRSPNTTTRLSQSQYVRSTDGRGRERDIMGFTLRESRERHRLTFTVVSRGFLYVSHPRVREDWFLDLIDIVLQCV